MGLASNVPRCPAAGAEEVCEMARPHWAGPACQMVGWQPTWSLRGFHLGLLEPCEPPHCHEQRHCCPHSKLHNDHVPAANGVKVLAGLPENGQADDDHAGVDQVAHALREQGTQKHRQAPPIPVEDCPLIPP